MVQYTRFEYTSAEWDHIRSCITKSPYDGLLATEAKRRLEMVCERYLDAEAAPAIRKRLAAQDKRDGQVLRRLGEEVLRLARSGDIEGAKSSLSQYTLVNYLTKKSRVLTSREQPDRARLLQNQLLVWADWLGLKVSSATFAASVSTHLTSSRAGGECVEFLLRAANPAIRQKGQALITPDIARHAVRAFQQWYHPDDPDPDE